MRPNILFLFPDQWRGDWWSRGRSGLPLRTPFIDQLAERGTTFAHAYSPAPLCAPARASLATGGAYPASGVIDNAHNLPDDTHTVYRALRDGGYHVMGCGKFDLHKATYSWGPSGTTSLNEWGFSAGVDNEGKIDGVEAYRAGTPGPYLSYLASRGTAENHVSDFAARIPFGTFPTTLGDEDYCDNWITRNALDLLTAAPAGEPWFLQVNFAGPHDPFDVTADMAEWYRDVELGEPFGAADVSLDHRGIRQNYAAMIENIDRNIGAIMSHPRVRDEAGNTVVIFASDHGELLGDHGWFGKCTPHNGSVHVPLVVAGPGVTSGALITQPVSIADLTATIAHVAGVCEGRFADSESLMPHVSGAPVTPRAVHSSLHVTDKPDYQWRCVIADGYKYVLWDDGTHALFRLDDYEETADCASDYPELVRRLESVLPPHPEGKEHP